MVLLASYVDTRARGVIERISPIKRLTRDINYGPVQAKDSLDKQITSPIRQIRAHKLDWQGQDQSSSMQMRRLLFYKRRTKPKSEKSQALLFIVLSRALSFVSSG
jgi:hypothetical protein